MSTLPSPLLGIAIGLWLALFPRWTTGFLVALIAIKLGVFS
jgi:hypothetical protein